MSFVDYGQTAEDHQSLLVLVRHTGSHLPTNLFNRVWERVRALNVVHVQGQNRNVVVRHKRGYPRENNEWGDFQAHRKVLGLVSVGKCVDHTEFADLFENYKRVKDEYSSTIINSRLIIFGMNTDGSPLEPHQQQQQQRQSSSSPAPSPTPPSSSSPPPPPPPPHSEQSPSRLSSDSDHGASAVHAASDESSSPSLSRGGPGGDQSNGQKKEKDDEAVTESESQEGVVSGGGGQEGSSPRRSRTDTEDNCSVKIFRVGGDNASPLPSSPQNGGSSSAGGGKNGGKGSPSRGGDNGKEPERRPHSNSLTKESTGSEVVFYPSLEQCEDLEERLKEFVTSLFFVLEGKRLERTFERSDRLVLLCAPFEKKDYIGVDTDTKSFKRKCMGRLRKHLGDLCLQAALPGEAILHYQTALDLLRAVNDFLWMGACYEGLCSASVVLTSPVSLAAPPLRRNQSFSVKRAASSPDTKHKANTVAHLRQQTSMGSVGNGLDHMEQQTSLHCLNPDDIIEKYKEAITNYSKYKNAAMVEMEASLKACRVLIYQRKYLQASDFLQNVVYINHSSPEEDKIQRYSTLSSLYGQIGFSRKESFFRRVAAMQCVSPGSNPAWQQCYQLLLQAVEGYNIELDPRDSCCKGDNSGWPVIQHRVLHELVYSARRIGNPQLAVRHSTLLLHTMYAHLTAEEQKEAVSGLETLTSKCQGTPQPLSTDTGLILPPVHLTTLPSVRSFKVLSPPPHLRPLKLQDTDPTKNIFIYTPLLLGTADRNTSANSPNVDFKWVAEDMCEVQLQLLNPLSVEMRLLYMGLLTEGVEVEVFPASPSVPPQSTPMTVKLLAKPQSPGHLKILGYSTQVFGVRSHCKLRDIPLESADHYSVEVVPALPQVSLVSSLPKAATFTPPSSADGATVVAKAATLLYAGQSQDSVVTIHNISSHPVTSLSVKLDARSDAKEHTDRMFQWSNDNIQSQLPLQPGAQLCIALCLYAHSDFLLPPVTSPEGTSSSMSSRSHPESSDKGTQRVEALLCVEYTGGPGQEAGYCRRCSLAIKVDVVPSLYITNWDALPANSGQEVSLVLDVLNVSSHQADVQCDNSSSDPCPPVIIESQQCRRIALTLPRVTFPEQEPASKFESRIPVKYRSWKSADFHSQFLSTYVDLRWTMPAAKVKGNVCIDYLKWTEHQIDLLSKPDISWKVLVNKQQYTAPDVMSFPSAQPVTVEVTLAAAHESYEEVTLTVQPAQETGEGEGQRPLTSDSYVCLGSQTMSALHLGAESDLEHSCSFLFLSPGRFHFHISCSARGQSRFAARASWSCVPVPQFSVL